MKVYNSSVKSLYKVFSEYNADYVRIAAKSFMKEQNTYASLVKAYGPLFDGVGRVLITSYMETEKIKRILIRLEERIKVVKILTEEQGYKENDILKLFYSKSDLEILAITRQLLKKGNNKDNKIISTKELLLEKFKTSERLLSLALDFVEDNVKRQIYVYYYGIERPRLSLERIIDIFSGYNEQKIMKVLLEIQNQIPELLKKVPEDRKNAELNKTDDGEKQTKRDFKYNSFFEYVYSDNDSVEVKLTKKKIALEYMKKASSNYLNVVAKIFTPDYNSLNTDILLSDKEVEDFEKMCDLTKKYVERKLGRLKAKNNRLFKARNKLKVRLFDNLKIDKLGEDRKRTLNKYLNEYFSRNQEAKACLDQFYDLSTCKLRADSYVSKNDISRIKDIINEMNEYIKKRDSKSEYPSSLLDCFINSRMSQNTKFHVNCLILAYLQQFSSIGKMEALKLWGEKYDSINVDVELTDDEKNNLNILIIELRNYIDKNIVSARRKANNNNTNSNANNNAHKEIFDSYLAYFLDPSLSEEENNEIIKRVIEIINQSRIREIIIKYYGEHYNKRNELVMTKDDRVSLKNFKYAIRKKLSTSLEFEDSLVKYYIAKRMTPNTKNEISRLLNEFMNSTEHPGKLAALKLYGEKYDSINSEVKLTNDEKNNLRDLITELRDYIDKKMASSRQYFKSIVRKKKLDSYLAYFLDPSLSEEENNEVIKRVIEIINQSRIREIIIKYYGEHFNKRNELSMTDEDRMALKNFRHAIRRRLSSPVEFKDSLVKYFVANRMTPNTKNEISRLLNEFMNSTEHPGKLAAIKLYGENYESLNPDVILNSQETSCFFEMINLAKEYITIHKPKKTQKKVKKEVIKKTPSIDYDYFFDFLVKEKKDDNEIHEDILLAKEYLRITNSKHVEVAKHAYGEDFGKLKVTELSPEEKHALICLRNDIKKYIIRSRKSSEDIQSSIRFRPKMIDYFDEEIKCRFDEETIINRLIYNLNVIKPKAIEIVLAVYGENLDQFNKCPFQLSLNDRILFNSIIATNRKFFINQTLVDFNFKDDFLSYFFESLDNRSELIKKVNDCLATMKDSSIKIIRYCYDDEFKLKKSIKVTDNEFKYLNQIIEKVTKKLEANDRKARRDSKEEEKSRGLLNMYFLDYFKLPGEEKVPKERIETIMETMRKTDSKYMALLQDIYGEDYSNKAKYRKVSRTDRSGINYLIKRINGVLDNKNIHARFSLASNFKKQFYLQEDTQETKNEIDKIILFFLETSNSQGADIVKTNYDDDYNLKGACKLDNNQKSSYRFLVKSINALIQKYRNGEEVNTKTEKVKEYFFDYFITDDMSLVDIVKIVYIYEKYSTNNRSEGISLVATIYDKTYHLRESIEITDEMKSKLRYFKNYFKNYVLKDYLNKDVVPDEYLNRISKLISDGVADASTIDMMDLGSNSAYVLTNDLFDLDILQDNQMPKNSSTDEAIMKAYLEVRDSKTIIDLLEISKEDLISFYLNNLEKLEDMSEALRFILQLGDKDVIKRLFVTPLFVNVANDLSDQERQILYLKLVQVGDDSITDEEIANITKAPVELISKYEFMSKDERVNQLNDYIRKLHE